MSNKKLSDLEIALCWERKADFWHGHLVTAINDQDALRDRIAELEAMNERMAKESEQRNCAATEAEVERLRVDNAYWQDRHEKTAIHERSQAVIYLRDHLGRAREMLDCLNYALDDIEQGKHWYKKLETP
jgi:predicted RNase H-like nuclease (RuvC/YqgF family)